ncbi:MAG: hypothetical protein V3V76_02935 [Candidatus Adiutricales bacterium]
MERDEFEILVAINTFLLTMGECMRFSRINTPHSLNPRAPDSRHAQRQDQAEETFIY